MRIAVDLSRLGEGLAGRRLTCLAPKELGAVGEEIACRELQARGWGLVGRNIRVGRDEIDLLFVADGELRVVEVKSRKGDRFGLGREAMTADKLRRMRRAASAWLRLRDDAAQRYPSICFDCAEVTVVSGSEVDFELVDRIEES